MKSEDEIGAAVCEHLARFTQDFLGLAPSALRADQVRSLLIVRLQGMLTVSEKHLLMTPKEGKSREIVKQMRKELMETARPVLVSLIEEITARQILSFHHDLSTVTGEAVIVFTFVDSSPTTRQGKRNG